VANYFKAHGWVKGDLVAVQAMGRRRGWRMALKLHYSVLAAAGLTPQQPLGNHQQASLLRLDVGRHYEYWYGLPNFYTITRYNHSTHYAMAVWQLGQAVSLARVSANSVPSPGGRRLYFDALPRQIHFTSSAHLIIVML
jgi:membrane-bound lytic murein transglycosylase B